MDDVTLTLPVGMWSAIKQHLLPKRAKFEEAAFVFATIDEWPTGINLQAIEWHAVPPQGFDVQSRFFLQLTDETKGMVIKRAHDLQAALIEVHSHPFQARAEFSPSDLPGFAEFVPHVRWRLKRRPYAAVVVANRTFDALAWAGDGAAARPLLALVADGMRLYPTAATEIDSEGTNGPKRPIQPQ